MKFIEKDFKEEISRRIEKIRSELRASEASAILIGYNANLYYSAGRFFRGYVFVTLQQRPLWFVIKPKGFEPEEDLVYVRKPEEIPQKLLEMGYPEPESIALEENDLTYSDIIRLKALFPAAEMKNGSVVMKRARMRKTEWEISEMKEDGRHHIKVYGEVKSCYRPGMSDLEFQIEIERKLRLEGSLGVSRVSGNLMEINLGSVISGNNADTPSPYEFTMGGAGVHPTLPVGADGSQIKEGETVMIDMNGAFNGYQTDMTRVWSRGEISALAHKAHDCSIKILRRLEKEALPEVPVRLLYEKAMELVESEGLKDYFMGHMSQVSFIGHGVGIELNELPVINARSKDILKSNMTLAIEPKFVVPGVGAVGVENTYVVREDGLENLTPFPEGIEKL
ncbi:MAG: aminopeptidase P family protein [Muribaculaceae bacterium]|nr:aminopeptidase P family protein [Muribaculaceae bacterium]